MQLNCKKSLLKRLQTWSVPVAIFAFVVATLPAPLLAEESGDVATGKALFTGSKSFKNSAPACMSCHNAGLSVGALGGGSLGPDLTTIMADEDRSVLINADWINGEDIPVMGPIFSRHNVTESEVAHLAAFLTSVSKDSPSTGTGTFFIISLAGAIVMMIIFSVIWGNRYRKRCKDTAHDALWRNYGGKGGM